MQMKNGNNIKTIAIITCCGDDWGGSEELWARSIPTLQDKGYAVIVYKGRIKYDHPRFSEMKEWGVQLKELEAPPLTPPPPPEAFSAKLLRKAGLMHIPPPVAPKVFTFYDRLRLYLEEDQPDLLVVAQGINFDGLGYAQIALDLHIPYTLICQKAVEFYWPAAADRPWMEKTLREARQIIFVSRQNQLLTEEQFGIRLPNARIIYNPVKVSGQPLPYPSTEKGFRLACIGRLFILDKGQDILLSILDQPIWRERPLHVSFIGKGIDEEGLRSMAALLDLTNVTFTGQVEDIEALWADYHALVLPSRSEGLALVILEAMAAGRTIIATRAGGTEEVVQEGITGFIGDANRTSFEQALEKAWNHRSEWEYMGKAASAYVRSNIPPDPEIDFAHCLITLLHDR